MVRGEQVPVGEDDVTSGQGHFLGPSPRTRGRRSFRITDDLAWLTAANMTTRRTEGRRFRQSSGAHCSSAVDPAASSITILAWAEISAVQYPLIQEFSRSCTILIAVANASCFLLPRIPVIQAFLRLRSSSSA